MGPTARELRRGNALQEPALPRWVVATVVEYFVGTQTYNVSHPSLGLLQEVPRLVKDYGDNSVLPADTLVVLHRELGYWAIDSIIKQTPAYAREISKVRTTEVTSIGGDSPQNQQSPNAASFRGVGDPTDMFPNDWVRHSGEGNFIGVLAGGMNVMESSPFAKIRTHGLANAVEIISHEYKHITSMGDMFIKNENGKTSMVWRAASDQATENGSNAKNWTLHLDVGATGDLFRFRVTTPQGNTLSEIHISPSGQLSLTGIGGVDVTSKDYREDVIGSRAAHTHGDFDQTVEGNETRTVNGSRAVQITQNDEVTTGGGYGLNVTGNEVHTIGGFLKQAVGKSVRTDVSDGYYDLVLGDPAKGGIPGGEMYLHNMGGNILLEPMAGIGTVTLFGSTPGSINLGADPIPTPRSDGSMSSVGIAPFSVTMFEQLNSALATLMTWLDTHVHPTVMGPSGPPAVPSTPIVNPVLQTAQSLRVKVGG